MPPFFAIYVIWGSTYLAIRYAVEDIPPLTTAGVRHLLAGTILFWWARLSAPAPSRREWMSSFAIGALFFLVGHGTLHWAERFVPSGVAALLVATEPLWIAFLPAVLRTGKATFDRRTLLGLILGMAGVALLVSSGAGASGGSMTLGILAILGGALAWAVGVVISPALSLPSNALLRAATTLLAGAILLLGTGALVGEFGQAASAHPSLRSVLSLAYLVVFGSVVAYGSYMWLLERCSPTLVATHTYVNPIVAMLLGAALGEEVLTARLLAAGVLIVGAVFLIGTARPRQADDETSPCGGAATQTRLGAGAISEK